MAYDALRDEWNKSACVYKDDILVFSSKPGEYVQHGGAPVAGYLSSIFAHNKASHHTPSQTPATSAYPSRPWLSIVVDVVFPRLRQL